MWAAWAAGEGRSADLKDAASWKLAEKTDVQPAQKPKLGLEGMGRTPEEQKQLDDLQQMLRTYEDESRDFKRDVQLLVEKKYEEKRSDLAASYEKASLTRLSVAAWFW